MSFAEDLTRVSGRTPAQITNHREANGDLIIAGIVGESAALEELVRTGKIDVADLAGQWEAYRQIVVDKPFPNVPRALVIAGSDRRGAVFGLYDISEKMGVSPWHWFADVPVTRKTDLYLAAGSRRDQPRVRYRGFFINDEAPAFTTWAARHFGGANSKLYAHVFELLLRMKGNYLWPAMWAPRAFNDDDPHNMFLADAMGVVMGTSHHEPMTRAQNEWHRNKDQGVTGGKWNYTTNGANLRKFWRGGIERMIVERPRALATKLWSPSVCAATATSPCPRPPPRSCWSPSSPRSATSSATSPAGPRISSRRCGRSIKRCRITTTTA